MRSAVVLVMVFALSFSHPTEERTTTTVTVNAKIESVKVTSDTESRRSLRTESHATVKCEYVHPEDGVASPNNHRACSIHCRSITEEYFGGKCIHGVCHCERALGGGKRAWGADDPHPTVKCVDLIPEDGEESTENDQVCQAHCRGLRNGYKKGECALGICFCSLQI